MPDSARKQPDLFDRILARSGVGPATPAVRPRLPNPFERAGPAGLVETTYVDAAQTESVRPVVAEKSAPQGKPDAVTMETVHHVETTEPDADRRQRAGPPPRSPGTIRVESALHQVTEVIRERIVTPSPEPFGAPAYTAGSVSEDPSPLVVQLTDRPVQFPTPEREFPRTVTPNGHRAQRRDQRPEPTIEVSIGRIEVGVTPSAKRAKEQRPGGRPQPKVGLEEHLAERDKGRT